MNYKTVNLVMFMFGAAVGVTITWQYMRRKYEEIAQKEIDSVKETFAKREPNIDNHEKSNIFDIREKANQAKEKPDITEYTSQLQGAGYINYSNMSSDEKKEIKEPMNKPYVIAPEDFGEYDEYDKVGLTYYADQVLTDDDDELVEDIDDIIGSDALNHFGEFEDDSVFVRNDMLKCDYEILLDRRRYSDVLESRPH